MFNTVRYTFKVACPFCLHQTITIHQFFQYLYPLARVGNSCQLKQIVDQETMGPGIWENQSKGILPYKKLFLRILRVKIAF